MNGPSCVSSRPTGDNTITTPVCAFAVSIHLKNKSTHTSPVAMLICHGEANLRELKQWLYVQTISFSMCLTPCQSRFIGKNCNALASKELLMVSSMATF